MDSPLVVLMKHIVVTLNRKAIRAYIRQQTCTDPRFDAQLISECVAANRAHASAQAALETYLHKTRS